MLNRDPKDWLVLKRTVRFGDTDAAGVMHFHNLFRWCHESWEESLESYGLVALEVFPSSLREGLETKIALPIVRCDAEFRMPAKVGDQLLVEIVPRKVDSNSFQVKTIFKSDNNCVAIGNIQHVAIDVLTRQRCLLPDAIELWLEASLLDSDIQSI